MIQKNYDDKNRNESDSFDFSQQKGERGKGERFRGRSIIQEDLRAKSGVKCGNSSKLGARVYMSIASQHKTSVGSREVRNF